jgi:enoyl-[acyl-carrier protein] reductase I
VDPAEVGNAALFLASELASGVTGEVLYVDCGYNVVAFSSSEMEHNRG